MINRGLIRVKIVQLVYAYYMCGGKPLDVAERELLTSLSKATDMYYHLLNLIVAVAREERKRYELADQRAKREGTEPPSDKFVNNRFPLQLEENETLAEFNEEHKYDWNDDLEAVRKICNQIEASEDYKEYLESDEDSYDADREIWRKMYKSIITSNEDLDAVLEEKSIYWNDDKDVVDTFVIKTIKRFDPANQAKQELLPEYKDSSDYEYAKKLFRAALINKDEYQQYLSKSSRNWELNRMPFTDIVIMQVALAEMCVFPEIPVSVTINEFVEVSKHYSTPRSASFINGMLDNIARTLIASGRILKQI